MIKKLTVAGSTLYLVAAVLCLVTGQFLLAMLAALIGVAGFRARGGEGRGDCEHSVADQVIASDGLVPSAEERKRFWQAHPELTFSEAVLAFREQWA